MEIIVGVISIIAISMALSLKGAKKVDKDDTNF